MVGTEVEAEVEAEKEWIEAPGGWGGNPSSAEEDTNDDDDGDNNDDDNDGDNDEESSPFDLFANVDKSLKFPFDVVTTTMTMTTTTTTTKDKTKTKTNIVKRIYLSGYKLDSDETAQSTGVTLWDAAPRLAKYIMNHEHELLTNLNNDNNNEEEESNSMIITGKRILELGSGLGLCGIVAYHLGAKHVMMTDADTITLEKMRLNVKQNCSCDNDTTDTTDTSDTSDTARSIDCKQLIWNEQLETFHNKYGNWDTILGADVIYTRESLEPLFDTVLFFLQQNQLLQKNSNNKPSSSSSSVGRFILSRYNKWGDISDETVLDAAKARNFIWTKPSEGIFVFQLKR
jgi:hypothetical protein